MADTPKDLSLIPDLPPQPVLPLEPAHAEVHRPFKRKEATILSSLRYPGSKRRLAGFIEATIRRNNLKPKLFVEPFAGGASVALQMLNNDAVELIGLIDLDPLVAAFWKTVFHDSEWLIEQVETIEVTLDNWHKFKIQNSTDRRDRALACLFLNRTSFSGIMRDEAGPIGGKNQASEYDISCRFPRKTLTRRIKQAAALKHKVAFVWNTSWDIGIKRIRQQQLEGKLPNDIFYYFDPPFFDKADKLYRHFFEDKHHRRLRDAIINMEGPWILSYDSAERFHDLYQDVEYDPTHVELLYTTARKAGHVRAKEVILTNMDRLPLETRMWRRNSEWLEKSEGAAINLSLAFDVNDSHMNHQTTASAI